MKKTGTAAALVIAGSLLCTAVFAGDSETAAAAMIPAAAKTRSAPHGKTSLVQALRKKHFLYLDMVQRVRPEAIRNAVIIYDHPLLKKSACSADGKTSVSECWLGPAV